MQQVAFGRGPSSGRAEVLRIAHSKGHQPLHGPGDLHGMFHVCVERRLGQSWLLYFSEHN